MIIGKIFGVLPILILLHICLITTIISHKESFAEIGQGCNHPNNKRQEKNCFAGLICKDESKFKKIRSLYQDKYYIKKVTRFRCRYDDTKEVADDTKEIPYRNKKVPYYKKEVHDNNQEFPIDKINIEEIKPIKIKILENNEIKSKKDEWCDLGLGPGKRQCDKGLKCLSYDLSGSRNFNDNEINSISGYNRKDLFDNYESNLKIKAYICTEEIKKPIDFGIREGNLCDYNSYNSYRKKCSQGLVCRRKNGILNDATYCLRVNNNKVCHLPSHGSMKNKNLCHIGYECKPHPQKSYWTCQQKAQLVREGQVCLRATAMAKDEQKCEHGFQCKPEIYRGYYVKFGNWKCIKEN